jgi:hypothetical protein
VSALGKYHLLNKPPSAAAVGIGPKRMIRKLVCALVVGPLLFNAVTNESPKIEYTSASNLIIVLLAPRGDVISYGHRLGFR